MLALLLAASVAVQNGRIVLRQPGAAPRVLTRGGDSDPALSPDGRIVAFVHQEPPVGDEPRTSLWVVPAAGGATRRLLAPRESQQPERRLGSFQNLHWSLDGRFVYLDADAWATSSAIHQVEVRTGAERFVVEGGNLGVVRQGRWRGYLLVGQHKYHGPPNYGSFDPVSLIRPDGHVEFRIPGSETDDGERSVPRWLRANRTTAS